MDSAEAVVRAFHAAWNSPNLDELVAYFGNDATYVDGPRGEHRGVAAIAAELRTQLKMGFGPITVEYRAIVSDGRTVMAEQVDTFEMRGRPIVMNIVGIFEIDESGQIERWREYYDLKSTLDQLEAAEIEVPE